MFSKLARAQRVWSLATLRHIIHRVSSPLATCVSFFEECICVRTVGYFQDPASGLLSRRILMRALATWSFKGEGEERGRCACHRHNCASLNGLPALKQSIDVGSMQLHRTGVTDIRVLLIQNQSILPQLPMVPGF